MIPADTGSFMVDATSAIFLQVQALPQDQQVPAIVILVNVGIFVGDLPEQVVKVVHGSGGLELFCIVSTALGALTKAALVIRGYLDAIKVC